MTKCDIDNVMAPKLSPTIEAIVLRGRTPPGRLDTGHRFAWHFLAVAGYPLPPTA